MATTVDLGQVVPTTSTMVNTLYPVGTVFECKTSVADLNPATLFSGTTWTLDTTTYQFEGIKRYWRKA